MSAALVPTLLTPQNSCENHFEQHFWPNLFLGSWLKGITFQKPEK